MGLFSTKKTVYGTSVSPLLEPDKIPDSVKTGLMKGIFKQANADINNYVLDELMDSVAITADRYYWFGKNRYIRGLPKCTRVSKNTGVTEVTEVLNSIEGTPVTVTYSMLGGPNLQHRAWMHLFTHYGYSQNTNILSAMGTPTKYLEYFQLVLPDAEKDNYNPLVLDMPGPESDAGYAPERRVAQLPDTLVPGTNQPIQFSTGVLTESVRLTYRWETGSFPTIATADTLFALDPIDEEGEYFHVRYIVGGVIKYWMYKIGDGLYPQLDEFLGKDNGIESGYFPIAYFRKRKISLVDDTSTAEFKSTEKLLDILKIDYKELGDSIHENEDIADVDTAMLMFAVNAESDHPVVIRYLYDYFRLWFLDAGGDFTPSGGTHNIFWRGEYLQDGFSKTASSVDEITYTAVTGTVGEVGEYSRVIATGIDVISYVDSHGVTQSDSAPYTLYKYRYQYNATTYYEIAVKNLKVHYFILGGVVVASSADKNILVPLDRNIIHEYSLSDREQLYCRGMHMVFNCRTVIKLKWYETGIFRGLLLIAAVVLTVLSLGKGFKLILLALALGGLSYALVVALVWLISQWLVIEGFKLFVKEVGLEESLILAFVLAVVSGKIVIQPGGLASAPWAGDLLKFATGLARGVGGAAKDMFKDLQSQMGVWQQIQNEQLKELEAAQKLLDTDTEWLVPLILPGETPERFYARTVHSGNIGPKCLSAIGSFVDNALTLPTIEQTLGGFNYGRFA